MKTGKKFIQVIIKSSADFPEKEGEYFCNRSGFMTVQKLKRGLPDKSYQREIRWYLIEQPEPEQRTAEEILFDTMTENNFTYVSFPAFVENESSVDVYDIALKAIEATKVTENNN